MKNPKISCIAFMRCLKTHLAMFWSSILYQLDHVNPMTALDCLAESHNLRFFIEEILMCENN